MGNMPSRIYNYDIQYFDQVHDYNPTVTSDGKIMFSRWEFMDRDTRTVFGALYGISSVYQGDFVMVDTTVRLPNREILNRSFLFL